MVIVLDGYFFWMDLFTWWLFFWMDILQGNHEMRPNLGNQTMHCWILILQGFFSSQCILSVALKGVERIVSGFEGIRNTKVATWFRFLWWWILLHLFLGVDFKFVLLVLVVWRFVVKVSCIKFLLTDMSFQPIASPEQWPVDPGCSCLGGWNATPSYIRGFCHKPWLRIPSFTWPRYLTLKTGGFQFRFISLSS